MGLFGSLFKIGSILVYQNKIKELKEKINSIFYV